MSLADDRPATPTQRALLWGMIAVLGLLLVYPIMLTVQGAFATDPATGKGFTLDHLSLVLSDPMQRGAILRSLLIGATTTIFALAIGIPLSILNASFAFPLKRFFAAAVLVPMILPPFVGALGVRAILGRQGALNALLGTEWDVLGDAKFWGVVLVQAFSLYPIIFLNTSAALANLDPALDEAAESVGAGWWRRFTKITLPLILPGIFAGATVVFIWSFTELGTPLIFEYTQVAPVRIFNGLKEVENSARPYALTLFMLVISIGVYIVGRSIFGRKSYAMYSKASRSGGEQELSGWRAGSATIAFALVTLIAILPHVGVLLTSVSSTGAWYRSVLPASFTSDHYRQALTASDSFGAIVNSLTLSAAAVIVNVFLGVVIAYLIVRTRVRGRGLLDALCMLPLAVPGLVMAFGYVAMTLRWPFGKGDPLEGIVSVVAAQPNPVPLLIVAYAIRRLPYIVRSTVAGLEQTSGELEEAAINLGATRFTAVRKIIVPLIAANLIAGSLLVFSFSMLEVSDSMILAQQTEHYPITKAIYALGGRLGDGPHVASALGAWGMALLTLTLATASIVMGRKLGAIFRV